MSPELLALAEEYATAVRADFDCWCRYVHAVCDLKDEALSRKVDDERNLAAQASHEAQRAFEARVREEEREAAKTRLKSSSGQEGVKS
jgi:hypothetical protein